MVKTTDYDYLFDINYKNGSRVFLRKKFEIEVGPQDPYEVQIAKMNELSELVKAEMGRIIGEYGSDNDKPLFSVGSTHIVNGVLPEWAKELEILEPED